MSEFERALKNLLNYHGVENASNTPDYLLASFLTACLSAYNQTVIARDKWCSSEDEPACLNM